MAESLRGKLVAHFESMMATIKDGASFGGSKSGQLTGQSAARMADAAMAIVRQHDEERGAQFTREQLAGALDGQWVYAKNRDGTHHAQIADADTVAAEVLEKLADGHPDMLRPGRAFHVDQPEPDPELAAMGVILAAMEGVDADTRRRLRWWVGERFAEPMGEPPW